MIEPFTLPVVRIRRVFLPATAYMFAGCSRRRLPRPLFRVEPVLPPVHQSGAHFPPSSVSPNGEFLPATNVTISMGGEKKNQRAADCLACHPKLTKLDRATPRVCFRSPYCLRGTTVCTKEFAHSRAKPGVDSRAPSRLRSQSCAWWASRGETSFPLRCALRRRNIAPL